MSVVNKRSNMIFYSDSRSLHCHRVRLVLAEKDVTVEIIDVDTNAMPEDVMSLSPYNELPVMVDRELVLHEPHVMIEYLDERFPHPPLLPVYPVARAEKRLLIRRVERDWLVLVEQILDVDASEAAKNKARKALKDNLITIAPVFDSFPYFMDEEFTIVDSIVAPILWRLPILGITIEKSHKGLHKYMERLFSRESFQKSLSEFEREIPNMGPDDVIS